MLVTALVVLAAYLRGLPCAKINFFEGVDTFALPLRSPVFVSNL